MNSQQINITHNSYDNNLTTNIILRHTTIPAIAKKNGAFETEPLWHPSPFAPKTKLNDDP